MIKRLQSILKIIPINHRKRLPFLVMLSFVNLLLDLISIAYLIPVFLLLLDYNSSYDWLSQYINLGELNMPVIISVFIASFVLKNVLQIKIYRYHSKYVFDVATSLSNRCLNHFLNQDFIEFQKKNTAKSIQNIKIIGADFSNHILLAINTFLTEGLLILILVCISLYFYVQLTLIVLGIISVIFVLLVIVRRKKILQVNKSLSATYANITSKLLNIVQGYLELKSLQKEKVYQESFSKSVKEFSIHYADLSVYKQSNTKYLEMLLVVSLTMVLIYIASSKSSIESNAFLLSFIAGSAIKLLPSVNKIALAWTNFQAFKYTIEILSPIREEVIESKLVTTFKDSLELKNIEFQYPNQDLILNTINLQIRKGDFVGITGDSGNGKTTLLSIIMNLLTPSSGEVILDDLVITHNYNTFSIINYLPQNPFIFEGSILENITLSNNLENVDYEKISHLSSILGISNMIETRQSLKLDINSLELSGGQKQRLALLRTLYHDFDILILDEATNQLDKETEMNILVYLKQLSTRGKTIVFVSHNSKVKEVCSQYYKLENKQLIKLK